MTILSRSEFQKDLIEHLRKVVDTGEQIVVGASEHPEVAVVPYAWLEAYERLCDRLDAQTIEEVLKEIEEEGTVPWEEVKARAGL